MEVQRKKEEHHYHGNGRISLQARPCRPHRRMQPVCRLTCACGCGEEFIPKRQGQTYINSKHRMRAGNDRRPVLRLSLSLLDSISSLEGADRPTLDRVIGILKKAAGIEDEMPLWVREGI